jgi:ATP phosphoribosyltransferase regulatory subunit HisZ
VTIPNPEHLFEQADKLIAPPAAGAPRQVDLRRAVSSAYYGVFHATLAAAADLFVGRTKRSTAQYGLVYRIVDHRSLRALCIEVAKSNLPAKYTPYQPPNGFRSHIKAFAAAAVDLQEKRHGADYDPLIRIKISDALAVVSTARSAVRRFGRASATQHHAFLSLLIFSQR